MGDDGAEGLSEIADGGQATISLTPDAGGNICLHLEMLQLEGSYVVAYPAALGPLAMHVFKPCRFSFCVVCWWCISSYTAKTGLYFFV